VELSTTPEATGCAATQEHPSILWNPKVYYCTHKIPPLVLILNQANSVNTPKPYLSTIYLNTGCGKKTSPISNGSYKQIKKDTEKIL
jgi:hypothetical protein